MAIENNLDGEEFMNYDVLCALLSHWDGYNTILR